MKPKKRVNRRKALGHLLAISHDPHFIAGAKEVLARKPFDYDGRRNDNFQLRYEDGRLIAIMVLQSTLCFLVMLALCVVPALAQQKWWMLVRGGGSTLDTCTNHSDQSPAKMYDGALANGWPSRIVDQGDEVNVYAIHDGEESKVSFFRTQSACQKSAQEHIDEKAKLDKYR